MRPTELHRFENLSSKPELLECECKRGCRWLPYKSIPAQHTNTTRAANLILMQPLHRLHHQHSRCHAALTPHQLPPPQPAPAPRPPIPNWFLVHCMSGMGWHGSPHEMHECSSRRRRHRRRRGRRHRRRSRAEAGARRPGLPAPTTAARTTPTLPTRLPHISAGRQEFEEWEAGEVGGEEGSLRPQCIAATDQDPGEPTDADGGRAALRSACRKLGPEL